MPTDLAAALERRRTQRLFAVHDETFLLLAPALFGLVTILLATRSPTLVCALILTGLH